MSFPNPARRRGLGLATTNGMLPHNNFMPIIGTPMRVVGSGSDSSSTPIAVGTPIAVSTPLKTATSTPIAEPGMVQSPRQQKGLLPIIVGSSPIQVNNAQVTPVTPATSTTTNDSGAPVSAMPAPSTTDTTAAATASGFSAWLANSTTILGFTIGNKWLLIGGGAAAVILAYAMSGKSGKRK